MGSVRRRLTMQRWKSSRGSPFSVRAVGCCSTARGIVPCSTACEQTGARHRAASGERACARYLARQVEAQLRGAGRTLAILHHRGESAAVLRERLRVEEERHVAMLVVGNVQARGLCVKDRVVALLLFSALRALRLRGLLDGVVQLAAAALVLALLAVLLLLAARADHHAARACSEPASTSF